MIKYAARIALAVIILATLAGFSSAPVQAQEPTIDLELDGEGATSWDITGIQPGDSGTKTVTLHNAGDVDGFVTIWISDLVSTEGDNPEPETGNTAEPGELDDYLLFNIDCSRLSTNISLPTKIYRLPQSTSSWRYLRVVPLSVGETITLDWHWELPVETGNVAQGDRLSFTINYMLEEGMPPPPPEGEEAPTRYYLRVDLWGEKFRTRVTSAGKVKADLEAVSDDEMVTLRIASGVLALTKDGRRLREIEVWPMAQPPSLPENGYIIGVAYDFSLGGATFDPPIELEIKYDPSQIPSGLDEEDLFIGYYDEDAGEWVECECTCDPETHCVTACICHFTCFAIIGAITPPPPPAPAAFSIGSLNIFPGKVDIGETTTISIVVANTGGQSGSYEVVLKINGEIEQSKETTLAAGESRQVSFSVIKDDPGTYAIAVDGLTGEFIVLAPAPPSPAPASSPPWVSTYWWVILLAAVIIAVMVYFLAIRPRHHP